MHRRILDRFNLSAARGSGSLFAALGINAFGAGMFLFYPFAMLYFTRAPSHLAIHRREMSTLSSLFNIPLIHRLHS
jgi:hypothetical protein